MREPRTTQLGVQGKDEPCSGKMASSSTTHTRRPAWIGLRQLLPQVPPGIFLLHFWAGFELMEKNTVVYRCLSWPISGVQFQVWAIRE